MFIVLQSDDGTGIDPDRLSRSVSVGVLLTSAFFTFILGVLFGILLSLRYPLSEVNDDADAAP